MNSSIWNLVHQELSFRSICRLRPFGVRPLGNTPLKTCSLLEFQTKSTKKKHKHSKGVRTSDGEGLSSSTTFLRLETLQAGGVFVSIYIVLMPTRTHKYTGACTHKITLTYTLSHKHIHFYDLEVCLRSNTHPGGYQTKYEQFMQ